MARTIPAPANVELPDADVLVPGGDILAGSSTKDGHPLHLGQALNLSTATHRAGMLANQGWADNQQLVTSVPYIERARYRLPKISSKHVDAYLIARASATAASHIQLQEPTSGNTGATGAIGAAAFYTTAVCDLTGNFTAHAMGDYVDLVVNLKGTALKMEDLGIYVADHDPSGNYPTSDGALDAGVIDDAVAFDDDEFAADRPASARQLRQVRKNIEVMNARPLSLWGWSGVIGATGVSSHQWMTPYPHRVTVPVLAETRSESRLATVWIRAWNNTAADFDVWIQHGPAPRNALFEASAGLEHDHITRVVINKNNAALFWQAIQVRVPETREYVRDLPGVYPGMTTFGVLPEFGDATRGIAGIDAWIV